MRDEHEFTRLKELLNKPEYQPRGAEERSVSQTVPQRLRRRGRPSRLDDRRRDVLKMLEGGKRFTRQEIMKRLGIMRKATFYEIADGPLDASNQIFLDHDEHDRWYLKPGRDRRRTMNQCQELRLLIDTIRDERLDFYIPRREWNDSLLKRAVNDRLASLLDPASSDAAELEELPKMTLEETRKYFEKKYSDTTTVSGVPVRRSILPLLRDDRDRERGAIYWHIEAVEKKPDGKKLSKAEREAIREVDQPKIKRLLEKCGPMSPDGFMYLIPEAFLLCLNWLDKEYLSGERSLAEMSDEELARVRREAFGRTKRVSILYSFDADEAFNWFKRHRSDKSVQDELRSRFGELASGIKAADRKMEELRREDEKRARRRRGGPEAAL